MKQESMKQFVHCHNGRCIDNYASYLDECIDCSETELIEHDLIRQELGTGRGRRADYGTI